MASITGYQFGRIILDGEEVSGDVIILPDRVVRNWWRKEGHSLVVQDLDDVLENLPARLVVGTGHDGRMRPDPLVLDALRERGIEVEVLRTTEAVQRYAELDPAHTAAALHLTC